MQGPSGHCLTWFETINIMMCGVQELKASEQAVKLEYHRSKCFDLNVIVDKDCVVYKREQHQWTFWQLSVSDNTISRSYKHRSLSKIIVTKEYVVIYQLYFDPKSHVSLSVQGSHDNFVIKLLFFSISVLKSFWRFYETVFRFK